MIDVIYTFVNCSIFYEEVELYPAPAPKKRKMTASPLPDIDKLL